jgi:protein-disulfide isomerase
VRRFFTYFAILAMASVPLSSAKAQELSEAEKTEIRALIEEYLKDNGEVIIDSVNSYQLRAQEEQQAQAAERVQEFVAGLDGRENLAVAGNPDGDVTVVEFFDYNCGYCHRALDELQTVLDDDDDVRVVLMDMPILGPTSLEAAKWALAAERQGKYWEYHQAIMNHAGQKDAAALEKLAEKVGLDIKQLKDDKDSDEIEARLQENIALAQSMGINGTPGFIIGDSITPGFIPAAQMKDLIKEERSNEG